MASDVNENVFSEKQLYAGDVVGEDDDDMAIFGAYLPSGMSPTSAHTHRAASAFSPVQISEAAAAARGGATEEPSTGASAAASGAPAAGVRHPSGPSKPGACERRRKRAAERAVKIVYWLESKYDILYEVCSSFENWKEARSASYDFDIFWSDTAIPADRFMKLKSYQKMNHFVGMSSITRKSNLGRNLLRMRKQFPKDYKFFPDTWILPTDLGDFKQQFTAAKNKTFIIKPDNGCQGKGIFLIRDVEKVPVDFSTTYVAQRYVHRPFLLDGYKFDLRLYVLVVGCDPLRIFLHKRGLVRLASELYQEPSVKNISQTWVHLTNYAANKNNPNFEENTDPEDASDGHKRSWEAVHEYLRCQGHDVDTLFADIEDLIVKTLIAVQPSLSHFYHSCQPDDVDNAMCFEVLGFDVILDQKLQPWLLEVNHAPSFATESELDRVVKHEVLSDTFSLLNLSPEARRQKKREAREKMEQHQRGVDTKKSLEERMDQEQEKALDRTAWEDQNLNGYKRLYPSEEKEGEYWEIHDAAINLWETLMGGTSRRAVRLSAAQSQLASSGCPGAGEDDAASGSGERATSSKAAKSRQACGESCSESGSKRTAAEIKEAVDRLAAGVSVRPRANEGNPCERMGRQSSHSSKDMPSWVVQDDDEVLRQGWSPPDVQRRTSGALEDKSPSNRPNQIVPRQSLMQRPEVKVGDRIKVQTNFGWEGVLVTAKRLNGKIDIQFQDGEYMRSVLPRVLREPHGGPVLEANAGATSHAPSGGDYYPDVEEHGAGHDLGSSSTPTVFSKADGCSTTAGTTAGSATGGASSCPTPPGTEEAVVFDHGWLPLDHLDMQLSAHIRSMRGDPQGGDTAPIATAVGGGATLVSTSALSRPAQAQQVHSTSLPHGSVSPAQKRSNSFTGHASPPISAANVGGRSMAKATMAKYPLPTGRLNQLQQLISVRSMSNPSRMPHGAAAAVQTASPAPPAGITPVTRKRSSVLSDVANNVPVPGRASGIASSTSSSALLAGGRPNAAGGPGESVNFSTPAGGVRTSWADDRNAQRIHSRVENLIGG